MNLFVVFPLMQKFKSMQPRDFHDEVVLSAEKCEKRRRREANANRFHWNEEITSNHTASDVLVLETQARSPVSLLDIFKVKFLKF